MAASVPTGSKFWFDGQVWPVTINGTNDSGTEQFWFDGETWEGLSPAAVGGLTATAQDTVTLSESLTLLLTLFVSVNDGVTVSETVTAELGQALSINVVDAVTASESPAVLLTNLVTTSDTVTTSEAIATLLMMVPDVITDTVTVSEDLSVTQVFTRSASDTITVNESLSNLLAHFVSVSETATATETIPTLLTQFATVVDVVTPSESVQTLLAMSGVVSDSVTVSETTSNLLAHVAAITETVAVDEFVTTIVVSVISVVDAVTIEEPTNLLKAMDVVVANNVAIIETIAVGGVHYLTSTFDVLVVTDALSTGLTLAGAMVLDTIAVGDAITEPLTWTIRAGVTPLEGVKVWLSYADPYTANNLVRDSIKTTNAAGQVSYDLDFDQVYYGWRDSQAYTFPDPFRFRYSSANSRWEQWNGSAYVVWNP